jgi:hypothetical protein
MLGIDLLITLIIGYLAAVVFFFTHARWRGDREASSLLCWVRPCWAVPP